MRSSCATALPSSAADESPTSPPATSEYPSAPAPAARARKGTTFSVTNAMTATTITPATVAATRPDIDIRTSEKAALAQCLVHESSRYATLGAHAQMRPALSQLSASAQT